MKILNRNSYLGQHRARHGGKFNLSLGTPSALIRRSHSDRIPFTRALARVHACNRLGGPGTAILGRFGASTALTPVVPLKRFLRAAERAEPPTFSIAKTRPPTGGRTIRI